jgi:hypothetical protein
MKTKYITETYDAIIRNVSAGNQTIGEITTNLYNQKIITKEPLRHIRIHRHIS